MQKTTIERWRGKKVLILGLGSYPQGSGISVALFFARQGAVVTVTDQKTEEELGKNVERLKRFSNVRFVLGEHRLSDIEDADLIVRNPRVRPSSPEMKLASRLGKRVESDVSLFMQRCPCRIVGITGTRGKSTTTMLIAEMLKRSGKRVWVGGNIAISPLTFLSKVKPNDIVVLELSSWLLETTGGRGLSPHVAVWTNLLRDHLNTYEGMDDYAEAKAQIFRHQGPDDFLVMNADDSRVRELSREAPGRVFSASARKKTADAWLTNEAFWWKDPRGGKVTRLLSRRDVSLIGAHNLMNILMAALAARAAGASVVGIRAAAREYRGLSDRLEELGATRGVRFINDTTATTPDATIAAIRAFDDLKGTIHLIAGGADKKLEFDELATLLKKRKVCVSVFPGTAFEKFTAALRHVRVSFQEVASMAEAASGHMAHATKGDIILLSPGCASFGLFKNEFDRGDQFRREYRNLRRKKK